VPEPVCELLDQDAIARNLRDRTSGFGPRARASGSHVATEHAPAWSGSPGEFLDCDRVISRCTHMVNENNGYCDQYSSWRWPSAMREKASIPESSSARCIPHAKPPVSPRRASVGTWPPRSTPMDAFLGLPRGSVESSPAGPNARAIDDAPDVSRREGFRPPAPSVCCTKVGSMESAQRMASFSTRSCELVPGRARCHEALSAGATGFMGNSLDLRSDMSPM